MAPKQTDPQFKLRLSPELKQEIEKAAAGSGRSMNAEILHRLANSFRGNLPMSEIGYNFFGEDTDGLRLSSEPNLELANAAALRGHSIRQEIAERVWFSFRGKHVFNEKLADELWTEKMKISELEAELRDARILIKQLSPAEKLILRERDHISNIRPTDRNMFREMIANVELRPIGRAGRIILNVPKVFEQPALDNEEP